MQRIHADQCSFEPGSAAQVPDRFALVAVIGDQLIPHPPVVAQGAHQDQPHTLAGDPTGCHRPLPVDADMPGPVPDACDDPGREGGRLGGIQEREHCEETVVGR